MSLKFIIGKAGSGKTSLITERMLADKEHNHIYIVPEQFALQSEINLSKCENVLLNIRVLSFQRLANIVLEKTGNGNTPLFEENGKIMVIRQIIENQKDNMEYFNKDTVCLREGIIRKISETIDELITYDVSCQRLSEAIDKLSEKGGELQLCTKLNDIKKIYEIYMETIKNRFELSQEKLDVLSSILSDPIEKNKPVIDEMKNSIIWIDSFSGFTPKEFSIIENLIKITSVNIAFALENKSSAFEEQKNAVSRLLKFCSETKTEVCENEYLNNDYRHNPNGELAYLEEHFFDFNPKPYTGGGGEIKIYSAINKYEETRLTAFHILELVKSGNYRFKDIGIVLPDDSYKQGIEDMFSRYDIPFFSDNEIPLKIHSLSKFIISALETVIYDYKYESVFSCIKTQYALNGLKKLNPSISITYDDIYDFENYVIANGIRGKSRYSEEFEKGFIHSGFNKEKINLIRSAVYDMFSRLKLSKNETIKGMTEKTIEFIDTLSAADTLEKMSENDEASLGMNIQVWDTVMNIFKTASEVFDDKKRSAEEYLKIISAAINNCKIAFAPSTADCVTIGDLYRSRFPDTRVIFIMNVNSGIFPQKYSDTGFISDSDKDKLSSAQIKLSANTMGLIQKDNFLMYTAFSKPSEKLFASYSKSEMSGEGLKPAPVIDKLLKLFPYLSEEKSDFEFISKEEAFDALMRHIRLHSKGKAVKDEYKDAAVWFLNDENYSKRFMKMKNSLMKINPQNKLSSRMADKVFADRTVTSVSRIEKFNECPFSYFIRYTLGANERKKYDFDNAQKGSMYHAIMEKFEKSVKDWDTVSRREIKDIIDTAVKEYIQEADNDIFEASEANKYFTSKIRNTMKIAANGIVNNVRKGKFRPKLFEYKFNSEDNENYNPIIISIDDNKKILLIGTIDRIDEYEDENGKYIKIVDYKSSEKECSYADMYMGVQLQLILYMSAYLELYGGSEDNIKPSCAFYMKFNQLDSSGEADTELDDMIDKYNAVGVYVNEEIAEKIAGADAIKKSKGFTDEDFKTLMDYIGFVTKRTCQDISDGNIEISPYEKSSGENSCKYCDYKAICCIDIIDRTDEENPDNIKVRNSMKFDGGKKSSSEFMKAIKEKMKGEE